jgi:organic radical activating enzyme
MTTDTLPVAEVFGPVWQGEGPHAGRRCAFIRLGLCNLSCEWCDTPYTWDRTRFDVAAECPPMRAPDIVAMVADMDVDMVVVSGGEPLIHQRTPAWLALLAGMRGEALHIETNGTLSPTSATRLAVDHFTVSPKINTGDPAKRRLNPPALAAFALLADQGRAAWKFVCESPADVMTAATLCDDYGVPRSARWVMPEGTEPDVILDRARAIADAATRYGFNLTLRNHALMYGAQRAV